MLCAPVVMGSFDVDIAARTVDVSDPDAVAVAVVLNISSSLAEVDVDISVLLISSFVLFSALEMVGSAVAKDVAAGVEDFIFSASNDVMGSSTSVVVNSVSVWFAYSETSRRYRSSILFISDRDFSSYIRDIFDLVFVCNGSTSSKLLSFANPRS